VFGTMNPWWLFPACGDHLTEKKGGGGGGTPVKGVCRTGDYFWSQQPKGQDTNEIGGKRNPECHNRQEDEIEWGVSVGESSGTRVEKGL